MKVSRAAQLVAAFLGVSLIWMPQGVALDAPKVGERVPDFKYTDAKGKRHQLSEHQGRYVVLEWTNRDCPFVAKHYESGNMQALQKELTGEGVFWVTIVSSAPGKPGHVTNQQQAKYLVDKKAAPSDVLLDPQGLLAQRYGAKSTPQILLIDPRGVLIYSGAIDDQPSADQRDLKQANNYVRTAYQRSKNGKPVSTSAMPPYGCPIELED